MAGFLTTYGANALLSGTPMPTTMYVKLHTGDPGVNAANNAATETDREAFTLDTPSAGAAFNDAIVQWINAAATEVITHVSLWDDPSAGNPWWVCARTGGGLSVDATDTISIDAGDIDIAFPLWGS